MLMLQFPIRVCDLFDRLCAALPLCKRCFLGVVQYSSVSHPGPGSSFLTHPLRQVPMAWCDLLLQEKLTEFLRFKKLDEFAETCQPGKGPFEGIGQEDERADMMQASIHKCLGQILCNLVPDPAVSQKKASKKAAADKGKCAEVEILLELATRLLKEQALPEDMLVDLQILTAALDDKAEDHAAALSQLSAWKQDDEYFGVLRPVVRNEHWTALVQQLSSPASAASTSANLRRAFNKVNVSQAQVPQEDRDELLDALLRAAEQPSDYDYLNDVLCGLKLLAEEGNKVQQQFLLRFCKDVGGRGVSAADFSGDEDLLTQMHSKGFWEAVDVQRKISDCGAAPEKHKATLLQTCSDLDATSKKVQLWHELLSAVLALAKTAQQHADNGLEATLQDSLVRCWSEVKHRLQTDPEIAAAAQPVKEALENMLNATKTEQVGPQVYEAAMQELRLSAMNLLKAASERRKLEAQEAASSLRKLEHRCMQCCALSDTPVFARSCVSFIASEFAMVCEVLPSAASEPIPDSILSSTVLQHLEAASDKETHKQKLLHVLQQPGCDDFLAQASNLLERLQPLFADKKATLEKLLTEALASAKSKFVDPQHAMDMEQFLKMAPPGEAVKKALKQLRAAERNLQAAGILKEGSALQGEVSDVKSSCRLQIIKWGIFTLVANADILADNAKGKGLRKTLNDIWSSHQDDGEVKGVLGQEAVDLVERSLAGPPQAPKSEEQVAKKRPKKK